MQVDEALFYLRRFGLDARGLTRILDGLQRIPEGSAWIQANTIFTEAIWKAVNNPVMRRDRDSKSEVEQQADWMALSNRLRSLSLTNLTLEVTNTSLDAVSSPAP